MSQRNLTLDSKRSHSQANRAPKTQAKGDRDLGVEVARFHGRRIGRGWIFPWVFPGLAAVLSPLAYGLWRYSYAYTHYGPVAADAWSQPWYQLAAYATLFFTLLAVFQIAAARKFAVVHKNGLLLRTPFRRRKLFFWKDMAGISTAATQERFLGLSIRSHQSAWIYPNVGKPVPLPKSLQDTPELVSRIKASLYPRLLPDLKEKFYAGQWLYFGPLSIHKSGLRVPSRYSPSKRDEKILWPAVERVDIRDGFFIIKMDESNKRVKSVRIPVQKIPNIELLIQLVKENVH